MKISRKTKRSLGFACTTMSIIIFLKELYPVSNWSTMDSYYSNVGDAFPSAEDPSFAPKDDNSIFFVETSYNGKLTAQKACAVEAAARAHPNREIFVLFSAPATDYSRGTTCLAKLLLFPNVKILRVHIAEFSKGTVVHSIVLNDLKASRFPIQHTADILRILALNKWGGTSLDTDIIVIRPLDELPDLNWIVQQGGKFFAPGLLSFSRNKVGSNVTRSMLAEILKSYNPNEKYNTGASVIEKVIKRMCPIRIHWDNCNGIGIYSYKQFYPSNKINCNEFNKITTRQDSYSFQWNYHSHKRSFVRTYLSKEKLARKFCPSIFGSQREELFAIEAPFGLFASTQKRRNSP